jgi:hypothetical protein
MESFKSILPERFASTSLSNTIKIGFDTNNREVRSRVGELIEMYTNRCWFIKAYSRKMIVYAILEHTARFADVLQTTEIASY